MMAVASAPALAGAVTIVVDNTNASGTGSLAQAITTANGDGVLDVIEFDIAGGGVPTIVASLPTITQPVTIDGTSQAAGFVEVRNGGGTAINITGSGSTVKGLVINSSLTGIALGAAAGNNTITGCRIGTDAAGTAAVANQTGVFVQGPSGGQNTITSNLISGNTTSGINLQGSNTIVTGNVIGLDVTQTTKIGGGTGVIVNSTLDNRIGGTQAGEGNVIAGITGTGISLQNVATAGTVIQGNLIGTNAANAAGLGVGTGVGFASVTGLGNVLGGATAGAGNVIVAATAAGISMTNSANITIQGNTIGTVALPHTSHGFDMPGSDNNTIEDNVISGNGGNGLNFRSGADGNTIRGNTITGNGGAGIGVSGGQMDRFTENTFHQNGGLGIDLGALGVNTNDPLDADVAPGHNDAQNYPVLSMVTAAEVTGSLNSLANTTFTVELFASPSCDASGNGEGATFLGSIEVMTNASGDATDFMFPLPLSAAGQVITATAIAPDGDTSEFSACTGVVPGSTTTSSTVPTTSTTSTTTTTTTAPSTSSTTAASTSSTSSSTSTTTSSSTSTSTSTAPATSSSTSTAPTTTSTSTTSSSAAPTTTTSSNTTTTTLTGSCATVPPGPTFRSLNCRIAALLAQVNAAAGLQQQLQAKLRRQLESARDRKEEAEEACREPNAKRTDRRLKQSGQRMTQLGRTLRSLRARKSIPSALRDSLRQAAESVRSDLRTLREQVRCPEDAPAS